MGEREKKWELWVARLLLSYLQHCVFYTSLAGRCDHDTKSSCRTARALQSAAPAWVTGFGRGPLLGALSQYMRPLPVPWLRHRFFCHLCTLTSPSQVGR